MARRPVSIGALTGCRCGALDGAVALGADVTLAVDRRTECIDNTAEEAVADRDTGGLAASAHKAALGDLGIVAKEDAADLIAAQVLHHALNAGGEQENLAVGGMLKATDNGDLIANGENRTGLFRFCETLPDFNAFSFSSNWRRRLLRLQSYTSVPTVSVKPFSILSSSKVSGISRP